jgi:hypothetical protein
MGRRPLAYQPRTDQTILIMGDSFAFGEGVDIEDRFDSVMAPQLGYPRLINIGVPGYGTDQQWIAARPHLSGLRDGDILLVLLYRNDFYDVLRRRFALRAKPFLTPQGESFELNPPQLSWLDHVRDRSYIAALIGRAFEEPESASSWDMEGARRRIRFILDEVRRETPSTVPFILAFHGLADTPAIASQEDAAVLCEGVDLCINLSNELDDAGYFLPDGHWTSAGHHVVGETIARQIQALARADERDLTRDVHAD